MLLVIVGEGTGCTRALETADVVQPGRLVTVKTYKPLIPALAGVSVGLAIPEEVYPPGPAPSCEPAKASYALAG